MNILKATEDIKNRYKNYILTSFNLNDKKMNDKLVERINSSGNLFKGPLLEVGKNFIQGSSLQDLMNSNLISKSFTKLNVPCERPLYKHQEQALTKVINNENIIVSTGTGSGKTESFLYPILDSLLKEKEAGTLGPGVRALILYPMNALARDQLDRLSDILKTYPDITFGSYTGEVEHKYDDALETYKRMYNKSPIDNELISREQIKDTPPNILITNYSMLEYLLLRPKDSILFNEDTWKYLVIDEAHMYTGAKAIEIGMLVRRLKDRINGKGNIQCILTSASLGRGEKDNEAIINFASKLCDEKFETHGIITGSTEKINFTPKTSISLEKYKDIYDKSFDSLVNNIDNIQEKFYEIAIKDTNLNQFYQLILEGTPLDEIKSEIFGSNAIDEDFNKFLQVIKHIKKQGKSILPLKYHLFIKSLEGAYASFTPDFDVFFERKETHGGHSVFEIGVCKNCNDLYIIGNMVEVDGEFFLKHLPHSFSEEYQTADINYFLIKEKEYIEDSDIDPSLEYIICGKCGKLKNKGMRGNLCSCNNENYIHVILNEPKEDKSTKKKKKIINTCISCGKTNSANGIIKKFLLSQDVATSIIAEGIYRNIDEIEEKVDNNDSVSEKLGDDFCSLWEVKEKKGSRKQLLAFSDNRQQAAFFASFFDNNYNKFLNRRLLIKVIRETTQEGIKKQWDHIEDGVLFEDLLNSLRKELKKHFNYNEKQAEIEAYKILLYEFVNSDGKNSLEELGLIKFSMETTKDDFSKLLDHFSLTESEFYDIINLLLSTLRKRGVLFDYKKLDLAEKGDFEYLKRLNSVILKNNKTSDKKSLFISWVGEKSNRYNFLNKVLDNKSLAPKFLEGIFGVLASNSKFNLNPLMLSGDGSYQLDPREFRIRLTNEGELYQCNKCHKITTYNVSGRCPSYKCDGSLDAFDLSKDLRGNHYRNLYLNGDIEIIRTSEHTAQLDKEKAREIQKAFIDKNINILSCSTTFEVGIDVGALESVFMRNMPPSPANYVQRAGRAGRRSSSDAFCVTYAALRSHDFTHYKNPLRMIGGKVAPPVFDINNKKIAVRHMSAVVLSEFWKNNIDLFYNSNGRDRAILFFGKSSDAITRLIAYLDNHKESIIKKLKDIFPENLYFIIDSMSWKDTLIDRCQLAQIEYTQELQELTDSMLLVSDNHDFFSAHKIKKTIETIEKQGLIQFVSKYNLIPKYGFPVDTISLETSHTDINLNRDLQVALKEYAPGAEVVANKELFTSRYLKKIHGKEERKYDFKICDCNQINKKNHLIDAGIKEISHCISCGADLTSKPTYTYTIPEFGFIAEKKTKKASKKPNNHYYTEKYYVGNSEQTGEEISFSMNNNLFQVKSSKDAKMGVLGKGNGIGFFICDKCGYSIPATQYTKTIKKPHKTHLGIPCNSQLTKTYLGYDYETDVTLIHTHLFETLDPSDRLSVLYAILNGISEALEVERGDIDGCFYFENERNYLVIFDKVPGGAGHSKRLLNKENIEISLKKSFELVRGCSCGIETSCYSCLRNYSNQNYHTKLTRNSVLNFFENLYEI